MRKFIKAFRDFYIYSSVHIALCAGLLCFESFLVLQIPVNLEVVLFITFSTMSVYCLHRLVGMSKVKAFDDQGRYKVIKKFKHHILVYFIISSLAAFYYLIKLPFDKIILLIVPILLTLAYVLPLFKSKKRLRDFPFIKIFLIAIVWTWLSLFVPTNFENPTFLILLAVERVLFFIAITIPFDIRDKEVDESIGVKTLVHQLGIKKSKILSQTLLLIAFGLIYFMYAQSLLSTSLLLGLGVCYMFCLVLIQFSDEKKQDWYFSGLLDGTIGLRIALMILFLKTLNSNL